jgi:phasin
MADASTPFQVPEQMRQFADASVEQARSAFNEFVEATQKALSNAEGSARSAQLGAGDTGRKALAFLEENVAATFDHAQKLVRAKTLEEIGVLQRDFLRHQFESLSSQGMALGETFKTTTENSRKTSR